jgi:hypothetical protein
MSPEAGQNGAVGQLRMEPPVIAPHAALTTAEVVALGGWHPRYARVIAVASAGGYGFALVDGNGDGSELEAEHWLWHQGSWQPGGSSESAAASANDRATTVKAPCPSRHVTVPDRPKPSVALGSVRDRRLGAAESCAVCAGCYVHIVRFGLLAGPLVRHE